MWPSDNTEWHTPPSMRRPGLLGRLIHSRLWDGLSHRFLLLLILAFCQQITWHILYRLKAKETIYQIVYHTYRFYRFLGYKLILNSCDSQSQSAVKMASYKKRFQSEYEIERMLEESWIEGGDNVFSESEYSSESESKSEESAVDNRYLVTVMIQCHQHQKEQRKRVGSGL